MLRRAAPTRVAVSTKSTDRYLTGIGRALEWVVVVLVVAAALAAVVVPRLTGATPYDVLTGSMRPKMPPGTLVVVRPVDFAQLQVGQVITYQPEPNDPSVITHRIVATGVDVTGQPVVYTQGDANPVRDPAPVRAEQVQGRVWYVVPLLGNLTRLLDGPQRQIGYLLLVGGLFLYAAVMLVGAFVDRLRRPVDVSHA